MSEHRQTITSGEAAKRLGVHIHTLRSWTDKGLVPYIKLPSGHRRFDPAEIERVLDEMYQQSKTAA